MGGSRKCPRNAVTALEGRLGREWAVHDDLIAAGLGRDLGPCP